MSPLTLRTHLLALLLLAAGTFARDQLASDSYRAFVDVPAEWVTDEQVPVSEERWFDASHSIMYPLISDQTDLTADTVREYTRVVAVPLNSHGVELISEMSVEYSPEYQTLTMHHVDVSRGGGKHNRLNAESVRLLQREQNLERKMYDGVVTASLVLEDIRVGDTVDYAYTIAGTNPVFGRRFSSFYLLGWPVPVQERRVTIVTTKKRKLDYACQGIDVAPVVATIDGVTRLMWTAVKQKPVAYEEGAPAWHMPMPVLQVTEYESWRDVAQWAGALYDIPQTPTAAMQRLLASWDHQSRPEEDVARDILDFVQKEIRYFGVELGVNSHMPSPPGEVLEARYGDCKDKTQLLVALLRMAGIDAEPCLVSTWRRARVQDCLPAPDVFDHVVATARIDRTRYWLDPTINYEAGPLRMRQFPPYGKALIIDRRSRELVDIETPALSAPSVEAEEMLTVPAYTSPVRYSVVTTYRGLEAVSQRELFATSTLQQMSDRYLNYYMRIYPRISMIEPLRTEDREDEGAFVTRELYEIPGFWEPRKARVEAYIPCPLISSQVVIPNTVRRTAPLAKQYPYHARHSVTVRLPNDPGFDGTGDTVCVEDSAVSYCVTDSYADSTLRITFDYRTLTAAVSPDAVPEHVQTLQDIEEQMGYSFWVPYVDSTVVDSLVETFVERLGSIADEPEPSRRRRHRRQ